MTIIYGSLSICLYAAGAALLTVAAVVYKRNGLYEYYCLKHGKPVRAGGAEKTIGRLVVRNKHTCASRVEDVQRQEDTPRCEPGEWSCRNRKAGRGSWTAAVIRRFWEKKAVQKAKRRSQLRAAVRGEGRRESSG